MTCTLSRSPGRRAFDCAYNLFRDPQRPAIFCAVPVDRPVPAFLDRWEFVRSVCSDDEVPVGFRRKAAQVGIRHNGFYLFQTTALCSRRKTIVVGDTVDEPSAPRAFKPPPTCLNDNGPMADVG